MRRRVRVGCGAGATSVTPVASDRFRPSLRSLRTAVFVLVAVLCAGCELRLGLDVAVDRDGGGTLALAVTADAELLQRASAAGAYPLEKLAAAGASLGDAGWTVTDTTDDEGARTVTLATAFDDPAALDALAADLTQTLSAEEVVLLEALDVAVTEERVEVSGAAGARLLPAVREYGLSPRRAERLLARNEALDYRVSVTPPGEVLDTNAPAAGDGPVVWTIAPGETVAFSVSSTRPGPRIVPLLIGGALGLLLAGLVLRLVVVRRRNAARRHRRSAG